jgi:PadR family transcriptional regulator PadR
MEEGRTAAGEAATGTSRFGLAPPRRFILPAVLLLLSERPGYGYALVPRLQEFPFGHVDRPAVYRALAQLERDGLAEASSENPTAGPSRRVYHITPRGSRVLRAWMGVIKEEQDYLGQVLRRYQATSTGDAVLAGVEGGWPAGGLGWSPVSSTSPAPRRLVAISPDRETPCLEAEEMTIINGESVAGDGLAVNGGGTGSGEAAAARGPTLNGRTALRDDAPGARDGARPGDGDAATGRPGTAGGRLEVAASRRRYGLVPDRSVVLIEVRSTVGPLSFGSLGVAGWVEAALVNGTISTAAPPSARIIVDMSELSSGNGVYDAELLRRIDARRFPTASVELGECAPIGSGSRYRLKGQLTFHGVTRPAQGTVMVEPIAGGRLVITGEQVFDIRDFAIPSPTVLMFRIYPDVRVRLHAEAELEEE